VTWLVERPLDSSTIQLSYVPGASGVVAMITPPLASAMKAVAGNDASGFP